ncbi:hypothetical protein [Flavobacterium sp.]|uniref:hypothetical protein n=1 Tax=Flavobacterium sp. TaxID=239 RepID=UPI003D0E3D37
MENLLSLSFVLITIITLYTFYLGIGKNKKVLIVFLLWQSIIGILNYFQIFKNNPKIFPLFILLTILIIFRLTNKIALATINLKILTLIHFIRVSVEFILYGLFIQKKIPRIMTFEGWNYDVFIGISSLFVFLYILKRKDRIAKNVLRIWNYIGIGFLLFIVSIAILSSPLPIQQFGFNQPNVAILQFPFTYLATCVVPLVLFSHILVLKKIRSY